ncbi:PLCH1 [Branchiostoma lanceolatum]|uniref:Phosphoinositide phospholipase C n=1 Tax=Branchiostoma lanceolatum TaxID=7740 RepID=A0A8J9W403_BRALA|nr:PLCH1 [Branchiostoma lanceolatum]
MNLIDKSVSSCLARLQEGSLLTKLKDGARSLPKNFYLDPDKSCIRWKPSRKGDNAKIPITYITDVREGLRSATDPPMNLDPTCCFHLIHGNEGEAIELVARSSEEAALWVRGLRHLVMEMREESGFEHKPITNWQYPLVHREGYVLWLLECFSQVDSDRDGRLTRQEALLLFDRLNIYDTSGKIQDMVQKAVEGSGLLDWEGFLGLYRTISTRQDLVVLLKKYSEGKDFLTAAELAQFLEKEQKVEACGRGQCLDIIAHCEPREDYMLNGWLGLDGFTNYLLSHHGDIFDSSHHAVHQDMTQPLSHYFIATSHNTYLQGDQLLSESSVDMYAWVLQSGCRCVELDCWDGPEGEPIVYHGYTLTSLDCWDGPEGEPIVYHGYTLTSLDCWDGPEGEPIVYHGYTLTSLDCWDGPEGEPIVYHGYTLTSLDCWDGPEGEPIVYHGYTLTSRVYFRDVIDVIDRYAFINNSYPVILCLENHCSLDQQRKMALYLTQILAGKLEVPPLPPGATHLPSPQDLRGKILIMSKKLSPGVPADTRCGEVSDEDSADEMEEGYKLLPGELMESSCRKHIVESYARSKLATLAKSGKTASAEKEHHKVPASPRQRARLALANSPLIRRRRGASSDHEETEKRQRERSRSRERKAGRSSSFSEADAVDTQDRKFGAKALHDTFSKLTHRKKVPYLTLLSCGAPGLPTLHSQEQLQDVNDIIPDNKDAVAMETHAPATAAVGERAQGQRDLPDVGRGRKGGEKHTRRMLLAKELSDLVWYMGTVSTVDFKSEVPCWHVPSISENKATALSSDHAANMAAFTRARLFRIYPSARRVDSSNYDPQPLWNMGCQMVALNYQTEGRVMQLNRARFSANGGCGYALKPAVMWEDNKSFNPLTTSPLPGVTRRQLTVRVLSGQQLRAVTAASEGPAELRVEVEVIGLNLDYHKEQTRPHSTDGYNPTWDDTMTFNLTLPDLAMVRFTVVCYYDHQQEVIGHRTVPFISLLTGYRHVHMEGHPASIFVHISVTDYQGKGKYRTGIKNFITRNWSLKQGGSFRETSAPIIKKPPAVNFTKRLGKLTMPRWHLGSGSDSASTASDEQEQKPAPDARDANVSVVRGDGSVASPAVWAAEGKGQARPTHLTMVRGDGTIASPAVWVTPGTGNGRIPEDQLRLRRRMSPAQTPGDNRCSFIVEDTSIAGKFFIICFLTELWDQKAQEYKEYVITEETEHPEQSHPAGQSGTAFQQEPIQHVNGQVYAPVNASQTVANGKTTETAVDHDRVVAKKGVKFEKKRPEMGRAFYIQGTRPKQSAGRSRKDKAPLLHKESYQPPPDSQQRTAYKHLQDSGTYMYSAPYRLRQAGTPPASPAKRPDSSHLFRHASADRLHEEREHTGAERRRRAESDEREYTGAERRRSDQRRTENVGAVQGYREVAVDVPPELEERSMSDSPYKMEQQSAIVNRVVPGSNGEYFAETRHRKRPPSRSRAERRSRQGPVPSDIVSTESKTSSDQDAKTPPQNAAEDKKVEVHDSTEEKSESDGESKRSETPTGTSSPPILFNKDSPPFVNGLLSEEDLQFLQQAPEDLQRILATEDFTNRTDEYKLLLERAKKSVRLKEIRNRRESYLAAMATEYSPSGKDGGGLGGRSPRGHRKGTRPRKAVVKPLQHEEESAPAPDVSERKEGLNEAQADNMKPPQEKPEEKDDALKQKENKTEDCKDSVTVTTESAKVKDDKSTSEEKDEGKDLTIVSKLDLEDETKETSAEQEEKQPKKEEENSDSSSDSPSSPVKTNATFGDSLWDEISDLSEVSESVSSSTSSLDTVIDTTNDSIDQELRSLEEEEKRAAEIMGKAKPKERPDPDTMIQQATSELASSKELQPPKDEVEMKKLKEKIFKPPSGPAADGGLESVEVSSDTSSETSTESQNDVTVVESEKIVPKDIAPSSEGSKTAANKEPASSGTEEDTSDESYAVPNKMYVAMATRNVRPETAQSSDETECFDSNGKSKSLGDITSEDIHCNKFDSKYKTISKSFITRKMREQKRFSPLRGPVMPKKPLERELIKLTTFTPEERALPQPASRLDPKTSTPKKLTFSSRSESRVKHIASRKRTQSESGSQDTETGSIRRSGGDAVFVLTAKAEAVPRRSRPPTPPIYQYRHSTGSYIPGYIEGPAPLLEDRGVPEGACSTPGTAPDIVPMASPQGDRGKGKLEEEPEIYFLLNV